MPRPNTSFARIPHTIIRCGNRLNPAEFRVLIGIVSWIADDEDECWLYTTTLTRGPKTATEDKGCGLSLRQVRRIIRRLESKGVLKTTKGKGKTASHFEINWQFFQASNAVADVRIDGVVNTGTEDRTIRTAVSVPYGQACPHSTDTDVRREINQRKHPEKETSETTSLSESERDGVEPFSLNTDTEDRTPSSRDDQAPQASIINQIYDAYPRHIGKRSALQAITNCLTRFQKDCPEESDPAKFLLERTKLFASSPAGKRGRFTPHPATWFNQDRWADEEKEWFRSDHTTVKSAIAGESDASGEITSRF